MSRVWPVVALAAALTGCSGNDELRCETPERYAGAQSVPPVRVPDGLSVPDETDSLRLPPPSGRASSAAQRCLEAPPDFFENRRPGGGEAAPAPSAPEPADDPERRIDN